MMKKQLGISWFLIEISVLVFKSPIRTDELPWMAQTLHEISVTEWTKMQNDQFYVCLLKAVEQLLTTPVEF